MQKEITKITLGKEQSEIFFRSFCVWKGIRAIFEYGVEPRKEDFRECTPDQYLAFEAQNGPLAPDEKLFGWFFPKRLSTTHEILIGTAADKDFILDGAKVIEECACKSGRIFNNYREKLRYVSALFYDSLSDGTPFERKKNVRLVVSDDSQSRPDHGGMRTGENSDPFRTLTAGIVAPIVRAGFSPPIR